jgi:hypothetical protein
MRQGLEWRERRKRQGGINLALHQLKTCDFRERRREKSQTL